MGMHPTAQSETTVENMANNSNFRITVAAFLALHRLDFPLQVQRAHLANGGFLQMAVPPVHGVLPTMIAKSAGKYKTPCEIPCLPRDRDGQVAGLLKIAADAGAQIFGLADVKDFILRALHKIKARPGRKSLYFFTNRFRFVVFFSRHILILTSL